MKFICIISFSIPHIRSVQFSYSVLSDSLRSHEPQHTRPPCPSPTPGVHPNPCPLCQWCHPTISSSVVPFSSCPQSFLASGSFQMSQLSASGGQSIGSFSFNISPSNEHPGLIFRREWCKGYYVIFFVIALSPRMNRSLSLPCRTEERLDSKPLFLHRPQSIADAQVHLLNWGQPNEGSDSLQSECMTDRFLILKQQVSNWWLKLQRNLPRGRWNFIISIVLKVI